MSGDGVERVVIAGGGTIQTNRAAPLQRSAGGVKYVGSTNWPDEGLGSADDPQAYELTVGQFAAGPLTTANFEAALLAAIAEAEAMPRAARIVMPAGDWNMTGRVLLRGFGYVKPSVQLVGAGRGVTRLSWPASYTGTCIELDGYQGGDFATQSFWFGGLFDFTVYVASDDGRGWGVKARQILWTTFERFEVRGFGHWANNGITAGVGLSILHGYAGVNEGNSQHVALNNVAIGGCTTGLWLREAYPVQMAKLELNQNRWCDWLMDGSSIVQMDGGMFQSTGSGADAALSPYANNPFYPIRSFGVSQASGTGAATSAASGGSVTVTGLTGRTSADVGKTLVLSGGSASKEVGAFLITGYVSATSLTIEKANGAGATGLAWAVHAYGGNNTVKIEGLDYHEGAIPALMRIKRGSGGIDAWHVDGASVYNCTSLADLEGVNVFTARRIIGTPSTRWIKARKCKRLDLDCAETPETHPAMFDLDEYSRNALRVVGLKGVVQPVAAKTLEEIMRAKCADWFDAAVNPTLVGDGTISSIRGLNGSTATGTTNKPLYIPRHPHLGGRPAIGMRETGIRNMSGTLAQPVAAGAFPGIIVVGHLPAGSQLGAIQSRRMPSFFDVVTNRSHVAAVGMDAWGGATQTKVMWRRNTDGAYFALAQNIDASGRVIMIGTFQFDAAAESAVGYHWSSETSYAAYNLTPDYAGGDTLITTQSMEAFQFAGEIASAATYSNDFDLAAVGFLKQPLHPDEVAIVMRMLQQRWGFDVTPQMVASTLPLVGVSDQTVLVDLSAANKTIALPSGHKRGDRIRVKVQGVAANHTATIDPAGSETVDGASTLVLSSDYAVAELQSDGTNWLRMQMPLPVYAGNPYIDPPTTPHAENDEFSSGSADLATRGWTVWDATSSVVLTRAGDIDPWTFPNAGTYRSTIIGSRMVIQCPQDKEVYIYKSVTLTAAGIAWCSMSNQWNSSGTNQYQPFCTFNLFAAASGRPSLNDYVQWEYRNNSVVFITKRSGTGTSTSKALTDPAGLTYPIRGVRFSSTNHYTGFLATPSGDLYVVPDSATNAPDITTQVYAGWHFYVASAATHSIGGIVAIDFFRRADGATAWIAQA